MDYILDGTKIVPKAEATVDYLDRGFLFGDGVYDLIGFHHGVPFKIEKHLERLQSSAEKISLELPFDMETLQDLLMQLAEANDLVTGFIYIQATRGSAPRTHRFPEGEVTPKIIAFTTASDRLPADHYEDGVKTTLLEDMRWSRCDIKSLNLLPNVMAKQEAYETGAFEALLHRQGEITEGSSSNIFAVKEGRLYTRPSDNFILNGITRQTVLEMAADRNLGVIEETFDIDFLLKSDEVFLTVTFLGIIPVRQIDDVPFEIGTITRAMQMGLDRLTAGAQENSALKH